MKVVVSDHLRYLVFNCFSFVFFSFFSSFLSFFSHVFDLFGLGFVWPNGKSVALTHTKSWFRYLGQVVCCVLPSYTALRLLRHLACATLCTTSSDNIDLMEGLSLYTAQKFDHFKKNICVGHSTEESMI